MTVGADEIDDNSAEAVSSRTWHSYMSQRRQFQLSRVFGGSVWDSTRWRRAVNGSRM